MNIERNDRPVIAITMGDAAGVGPEIIVKALAHAELYGRCRPLVVGDARRLDAAARLCGLGLAIRRVQGVSDARFEPGTVDCIDLDLIPDDLPFGELSALAGDAAYRYVKRAVELARSGDVGAICTAPLNKEALHAGGHIYPGHTELLADLCGVPEVSMMLTAPNLAGDPCHRAHRLKLERHRQDRAGAGRAHHRPRPRDPGSRPGSRDPRIGGLRHQSPCRRERPVRRPRGGVARSFPPIAALPGARLAGSRGPLPADTLFYRAARGDFDLVVAMYHDQGHGPVKVLGIEAGVNITVGLPVVRTSVDHGTAFDIAGTGKADERSLLEALR